MKKRFVSDEVLIPNLPVFLPAGQTEESLERVIDIVEEHLILEKAKEIEEKRQLKIKIKTDSSLKEDEWYLKNE